jgi:two-component system, OmpR family, sensor histidine kinase KdpD
VIILDKRSKYKNTLKSVMTVIMLLTVVSAGSLLGHYFGVGNESIIMLYLLAVLFATVLSKSYIFGIITAVMGVMMFNYLFTEPRFTFFINSSNDIMLLLFFLVTAVVAGSIMSRLQKQMNISSRNEMTARLLHVVSGGFLHVTGINNILMRGISYIYEYSGCIAEIELINGELFSDSSKVSDKSFFNEYIINGTSAVLGKMKIFNVSDTVREIHEMLFITVATQTGIALDREYTYNERENIRIAMEHEKLRSILLRAVAHDLRSPLTALTGASSVLAESFDRLSADEQKALAVDINEEMIWLANLVENILNMTRINESQLVISKEFEVVDDVVGEAVTHMKKLLVNRKFTVLLPSDVIALPMDGKLVVQVIINLLGNAVKHTPIDAEIALSVSMDKDNAIFSVADTGNGEIDTIKYELFRENIRSKPASSDGRHGMGLGLAICRAIIEGHGGKIWVESNYPQGVKFIFTIPIEK